jgi:hypothetical protein
MSGNSQEEVRSNWPVLLDLFSMCIDWGLELRLLDEGSNDRRIGVKLYATRQSHLPEVQEGQAIILSNLLVSFLCGSGRDCR